MDMRDQYGNKVGLLDAYGNPIPQQTTTETYDEYGNPIRSSSYNTAAGGYGAVTGTETSQEAQMMGTHPEKHHGGGVLHRSGSSSSSSSEDDGMGGRRRKKKGLKEKLPGTHKTTTHDDYGHEHAQGQATTGYGGTTTTTTTTGHHEPEKKGIMEKIKEKLPGHH